MNNYYIDFLSKHIPYLIQPTLESEEDVGLLLDIIDNHGFVDFMMKMKKDYPEKAHQFLGLLKKAPMTQDTRDMFERYLDILNNLEHGF